MQLLQSKQSFAIEISSAGVVEVVDASDSKSDERKLVGVQVPSPAPFFPVDFICGYADSDHPFAPLSTVNLP
jgi:hypothetical protein